MCACSGKPAAETLDAAAWRSTLTSIAQTPTVVYVWAPWSRPSVELLPTLVELEREYAAVPFLYLCLESADGDLLDELDSQGRHLHLDVEYGAAVEDLDIPEPPAVRIYGVGGRLLHALTSGDGANPLAPEDIADAIDQAAAL